jgi:uncharacterized protein
MALRNIASFQSTPVYVGNVAYGEDIHLSIEAFCDEHGIKNAWVQCLGALSEAVLAFYTQDTHQYVEKTFSGAYEIVQGGGNISLKDGKVFGHIHMTLSGHDFLCVGGHLMPGKTKVFACEFLILPLASEEPLTRDEKDVETGLFLWPSCNL